ncbi:16S rRNA (cytidine(1402)-2'-O)-methyltransferase [Aliarcobacter butzleri]|uniref:16S rRNA (cytidine(1402)-2'-O)-methyltransferase n=1 Tax=Aliarcobacter butzleri TaxID=28197 RepID=UPI0021B19712|nr:16S rRNA (cytidine(1402)-2'-O)-methyltransferase [Aliarcobacter butzleri]MCT7602624.1 16S rRNA (cytidine(1402)-2'-O)-methyltransferase [Aliarcobacter butzleri]MCT7644815.1 16S rRNA (cytidine(1402)-2'-O)-methyltransferase [Aliarcobacter butzleri]MDK2084054.1 16S rRNA (cytidine(1402)-2'-O)-methyltransferase [Aliarcobacter butzleri]
MLCLVPTPIGNLEDISSRSLKVLEESELIFCEDTRVTKKLLNLLGEKYNLDFSNKEYKSFHSHNENQILKTLDKDTFSKNVVYVSDAGMPCVSDPGATLVDFCIKNQIPYDVLPGANAILTAYAMSGFTQTTFSFYGFLDHKGASRASKLDEILNDDKLSILYESPHRLLKLLEELNEKEPNRIIFLAKEITKLHQTTYKNSASNLFEEFKNINIKGEWVVVIEPKEKVGLNLELNDILPLDLPPKTKAKLIAKMTGQSIKEVYQQFLDKIAE